MNRVILLEGLPGTGKTTNSYRLFEQLVRNGREVRWLHEVSQPHPTLFFSEACFTKKEYREKYSFYFSFYKLIRCIYKIYIIPVPLSYILIKKVLKK